METRALPVEQTALCASERGCEQATVGQVKGQIRDDPTRVRNFGTIFNMRKVMRRGAVKIILLNDSVKLIWGIMNNAEKLY
jgi:hypothetical protein